MKIKRLSEVTHRPSHTKAIAQEPEERRGSVRKRSLRGRSGTPGLSESLKKRCFRPAHRQEPAVHRATHRQVSRRVLTRLLFCRVQPSGFGGKGLGRTRVGSPENNLNHNLPFHVHYPPTAAHPTYFPGVMQVPPGPVTRLSLPHPPAQPPAAGSPWLRQAPLSGLPTPALRAPSRCLSPGPEQSLGNPLDIL